MADIFTKQVYVEKVYLTFGLKPTMHKLKKDKSRNARDIYIKRHGSVSRQVYYI